MAAIKQVLLSAKKAEAGELARVLSWSARDVLAQGRLLAAFGQMVRSMQHLWAVRTGERAELAALVLEQLRSMRSGGVTATGVVRVDALFRELLEHHALSLLDFRLALWDLHRQGRLQPGGSVPPADRTEMTKFDLLVPGAAHEPVVETIDLGAGDFLLPGESSQVLRVIEDP